MEPYDYKKALKSDIISYFDEFKEYHPISNKTLDEYKEEFYDSCWVSDRVTGYGSGSYWCDSFTAEEAICHNLNLYQEAISEYDIDIDEDNRLDAETIDVTIRCYLLRDVLNSVWDSLKEKIR